MKKNIIDSNDWQAAGEDDNVLFTFIQLKAEREGKGAGVELHSTAHHITWPGLPRGGGQLRHLDTQLRRGVAVLAVIEQVRDVSE
jgi:hypothetical protein